MAEGGMEDHPGRGKEVGCPPNMPSALMVQFSPLGMLLKAHPHSLTKVLEMGGRKGLSQPQELSWWSWCPSQKGRMMGKLIKGSQEARGSPPWQFHPGSAFNQHRERTGLWSLEMAGNLCVGLFCPEVLWLCQPMGSQL